MQHLDSRTELDALLAAGDAVLLKHGSRCSISAQARDELSTFATSHPEIPIATLEVTAYADLARYAAERLGIRHESPQVMIIRDGEVAWHAEHYAITARDLDAQLSRP
jgi:bacillithiol system protein YtxJ